MNGMDVEYFVGLSRAYAYLAQVMGDGERSERTPDQLALDLADPVSVVRVSRLPAPRPCHAKPGFLLASPSRPPVGSPESRSSNTGYLSHQ